MKHFKFCHFDGVPFALTLGEDDEALTDVRFETWRPSGELSFDDTPLLSAAQRELEEYFAGARRSFDLPIKMRGTDFEMRCFAAMAKIPYGVTISYGELARAAGSPRACRAAGAACHKNPIAIIVPCHRIIGANGSLTGFGGGLKTKKFLLDLEKRVCHS